MALRCADIASTAHPSILFAHRGARFVVRVWLVVGLGGCRGATASPMTPPAPSVERRAPPRPGESITHTRMCSCRACEPAACCRDLERVAPEVERGCSEGYDFSRCTTEVSSCSARCFLRRWRVRVEAGCDSARPRGCCSPDTDG